MAILNILQYPDLRLRRKGYRVEDLQADHIHQAVEAMVETLQHQPNCAGLTSTQLDLPDPPSIVVLNNSGYLKADPIIVLINLELSNFKGREFGEEGCMSIYPQHVHAKVPRATKVKATAWDPQGNRLEFTAHNFFARLLQHEYDHLQGVLYIDHLPPHERAAIEEQIATIKED